MSTTPSVIDDTEQAEADELLGSATGISQEARDAAVAAASDQEFYTPRNLTESRALELLGNSNLNPSVVANALGVTPARISQLLAIEAFSQEVTRRRFISLRANTSRDDKWDEIEDKLLERMKRLLPTMYKPSDILKALQVANAAKRRGTADPNSGAIAQTVVPLMLPTSIVNTYQVKVDVHNNVIQAGEQSLVTATLKDVANMAASIKPKIEQVQDATIKEIKQLGHSHEHNERIAEAIPVAAGKKSTADFEGQELSDSDI